MRKYTCEIQIECPYEVSAEALEYLNKIKSQVLEDPSQGWRSILGLHSTCVLVTSEQPEERHARIAGMSRAA